MEALADGEEWGTASHCLADAVLGGGDLLGGDDVVGSGGGDDHDAVGVADDAVNGLDADAGQLHGFAARLGGDADLAGAHGVGPGEDRVAELDAAADVTAHTVDDGTGDAVAVGDSR